MLLAYFLYGSDFCSVGPEDGTPVFMAAISQRSLPKSRIVRHIPPLSLAHYPGKRMDALALFVSF